MYLRHLARLVIAGAVLSAGSILIAGCGGTQSPACEIPERGNLLVYATDRLNPDNGGRALPTVIRVYQLSSLGNLELASFEDIWRNAEDTLGDTLLVADEFTIYPGRRVYRPFERDPGAGFIVGVAIVRRPAGFSWRSVVELPVSAEAQRCAALQADPEEEPPPPPISRVEFRVDGYRIEGLVRLDRSGGGCATSDLECIRSRADSVEVPDATEQPEVPEQPETPDMEMPSTPDTPSMP